MMVPPGAASRDREDNIRRKIMKLKKEGRIKKDDSDDASLPAPEPSGNPVLDKLREERESMKRGSTNDYDDKVKAKLGKRGAVAATTKAGRSISGYTGSVSDIKKETPAAEKRDEEIEEIDQILEEDEDERDFDEEALVDFVSQRLGEKSEIEAQGKNERMLNQIAEYKRKQAELDEDEKTDADTPSTLKTTTTGIGGSWAKNETASEDSRRPSRGSWGYFPRPNDISKAYGGGRRIGPGFTKEQEQSRLLSEQDTKNKLQQYRERVGIDVQSEKDNAEEIEEALSLATRAMQRGVYSTAVSVLEKVTKYCSTNSKVGGTVFLELAMAYEAAGLSKEASTIYTTLSTSRIEEIKMNAKKLQYGMEAINFMRNEARDTNFSKKKASQVYMEVTGLDRIADNFDDKYATAYVDLDKGGNYYKRLTQSVVRTTREARQILIKAVSSDEVDRYRVVQALRSISRSFDTALAEEISDAKPEPEGESYAIINGKRLEKSKPKAYGSDFGTMEFFLSEPAVMLDNLNGEWRLQLVADKTGDAVRYFNTSLSWQAINSNAQTFNFVGPSGFLTTSEQGTFDFERERRIITRNIGSSSGGFLSNILSGGTRTGASKAGLMPQQIMSIDEVLCVTKLVEKKKTIAGQNVKDYFCVWRKVKPGTFLKGSAQ